MTYLAVRFTARLGGWAGREATPLCRRDDSARFGVASRDDFNPEWDSDYCVNKFALRSGNQPDGRRGRQVVDNTHANDDGSLRGASRAALGNRPRLSGKGCRVATDHLSVPSLPRRLDRMPNLQSDN